MPDNSHLNERRKTRETKHRQGFFGRFRPSRFGLTRTRLKRVLVRIRQRLPPGIRLLAGLLLIGLGVLGFLPILGFWMIPLGIAVAMLDITPLWRRIRHRRRHR